MNESDKEIDKEREINDSDTFESVSGRFEIEKVEKWGKIETEKWRKKCVLIFTKLKNIKAKSKLVFFSGFSLINLYT